MYALILVTILTPSTALAEVIALHENMGDCFEGRDALLVEREQWQGFFRTNKQAICISTDTLIEKSTEHY